MGGWLPKYPRRRGLIGALGTGRNEPPQSADGSPVRASAAFKAALGGFGRGPHATLKARLATQGEFRQGVVYQTIVQGAAATRRAIANTKRWAQRPVGKGVAGSVDRRA